MSDDWTAVLIIGALGLLVIALFVWLGEKAEMDFDNEQTTGE